MKKLLTTTGFLLILAISGNNTRAQEYEYVPFPTKNAIWSGMFYYYGTSFNYPNDTMNVKYALFDEDTVFFGNGKTYTYHKLFMVFDSIPTREDARFEGYLMEDNKIVYYLGKGSGGILYDFSKNVGDTITVNIPIPANQRVYKIDTINLNGSLRKRFHMEFFLDEEVGEGDDCGVKWIEGIGSVKGLLWPGEWPIDFFNELLCLHQEGEGIYYNDKYGTCYPDYPGMIINSLQEIKQHKNIIIYPNPAQDLIHFNFPNNKKGIVKIISFDGKVLIEKQINTGQSSTLEIKNIPVGIYLFVFIDYDYKIFQCKFIKSYDKLPH